MIGGYFRNNRKPMVTGEVRIIVPNLGYHIVNFLVDTGSDDIVISSSDAKLLNIDVSGFRDPSQLHGFGAPALGFPVDAELMFRDGSIYRCYNRKIYIADHSGNPRMPSILGQEVIRFWDMRISASTSLLAIVPLSQDSTIP
jgi:hypothetical protein